MKTNKLIPVLPVLLALPLFFTTLGLSHPDDGNHRRPRTTPPATGGRGGRRSDGGVDVATAGSGGAGGIGGAGGVGRAGGVGGAAGIGGAAGAVVTCSPACNSATQACVAGACLLSDGQSCTLAAQCASGACSPFYVDEDGDGYGTGQALGFCGTTTPIGYAVQNGDCCDDASHLAIAKLIHPGAGLSDDQRGRHLQHHLGLRLQRHGRSFGRQANRRLQRTSDCRPVYTPFPASDCGLQSQHGGLRPRRSVWAK